MIGIIGLQCACAKKTKQPGATATAYGTAIVLSSGDKQVAEVGAMLDQPLIVQVNDQQGNGVTGAPVWFTGSNGAGFEPAFALTDSGGQVSTSVSLGGTAGRYRLQAYTKNAAGQRIDTTVDEIALGYHQNLGRIISEQYCARCHNPESTPERVSNYDNLATKPHPFNEGETLNKMTDQDLTAIISHGGPALSKSTEMPPYGYILSKGDIQALIAYIRAVSDPPYKSAGVVYANSR
jgi:mono/diheme cytochrome c family protein